MIYYRQKIDNLAGIFDNYSVVILLGENYKILQRDAKNISDEIAGPTAENEMRIKKYFNQEINGKKDEIISCLKTKSFFTGRQIIMLNDLSEKDYKIITDIDAEWQNHDALTIVTMQKLSQNSELKKLLTSSSRIALVNYTRQKMDREFFKRNLAKENINLDGEKVLETLIDFANFTPEDILENEFEKLKLFKLHDNKPLSTDDVINITSINYEIKELSLAVAVAERNMVELEKKISAFFSQGKSPLSILQFVSAYFYKLSLIKTYGPNSFEARREYPFLISSDLEKAKIHLKRWSSEQLTQAINSLTMSDLKLRKYPSLYQRSILTQYLLGILEI